MRRYRYKLLVLMFIILMFPNYVLGAGVTSDAGGARISGSSDSSSSSDGKTASDQKHLTYIPAIKISLVRYNEDGTFNVLKSIGIGYQCAYVLRKDMLISKSSDGAGGNEAYSSIKNFVKQYDRWFFIK